MAKSTRSRVSRAAARPLVVRPALPSGGRLLTAGLVTTFAGNPERFHRGDLDKQNPNFGANGERHDEHDRKPRYEVELMVRTFFGDTGARPTTDPNLVFWESPDIWIDGPSGDPDQATPGVTNIVNVHVWNTGLADCWAAHVELYWCDPSVGVTPALAQSIGSTTIPLMGGEHKIVPFPWVPTLANGGHECLVAQVYSPVSDPLISPFSPTLDRHVCQRNISVVTVAPGQTFQMIVAVPNLSQWAAVSALSTELLTGTARRQFFRTIGAEEPPVLTRAGSAAASQRLVGRVPVGDEASLRSSGAFREALDPEPARSVRRRVAGALQALTAPRGRTDRTVRGRALAPMMATPAVHEEGTESERAVLGERRLTLAGESVTLIAIEGRLARESGSKGRDVYRVVERVEGRVTGGVTLLVKPLAPERAPAEPVADSPRRSPRRTPTKRRQARRGGVKAAGTR